MKSSSSTTAVPRKRRWLRFSLRAMLVCITVIAVLIWTPIQRARSQKLAVETINRLGGHVAYDSDNLLIQPSAPDWLRNLVGEDYFRTVIHVSFREKKITDEDLKSLRSLPDVESLYLADCHGFTQAGFAYIDGLTYLNDLDLDGSEVTDEQLASLHNLPHLSALNLADTEISDAALQNLSALTSLKSLNLSNTLITDAGLQALAQLESLEELRIPNSPNISDAGLAHLTKLKNLQQFTLTFCFTQRGRRIADTPKARREALIEVLRHSSDPIVVNTSITDTGLADLAKLTKLKSLRLWNTKITDAGLSHLQNLSGLTELQLDHTEITDDGLQSLAPLIALQELHLNDTQITDAGLKYLLTLKNLRLVRLHDTKTTRAGIQQLQQQMPQLVIGREWPSPALPP